MRRIDRDNIQYKKNGGEMDSRAYTEVNYIINEMSSEMKNKIPSQILRNIENRMDKNYDFRIEEEEFENAELLEDTEKILSVLYTDYLASDEEKIIIKNKEKILENKKKETLANIELKEIFPKMQETNETTQIEENKELLNSKQVNWYIKIINFLKSFKK